MTGSYEGLVIAGAFLLDAAIGDPHWLPHPVRCIGQMIGTVERGLRKFQRTPRAERCAGVALVLATVLTVYGLSWLLIRISARISPFLWFLLSLIMAYTVLAARSLADGARSVLARLEAGELPAARRELSMIVGRDTESLTESEIVRAAVETVAENASDGVIAPLFYLALGGPALALAYKAVNTLDSMVGYKNERYRYFGWAAARLDDIVNYIPARITAVLICFSAGILRRPRGKEAFGPKHAFTDAWRIMLRDGRSHPSPNSGYPEAAVAGALGVKLGGASTYSGVISAKPFIGEGVKGLDKKSIEKSVRLMYCSTLIAVIAAAVIKTAVNV